MAGFYEYLYKLALKGLTDRLAFKGGVLFVRVLIDDRAREIPIKMRKMKEDRDGSQERFMLTSIASEPSEVSRVTVASKIVKKEYALGKASEFQGGKSGDYSGAKSGDYPAARLKLMMIK